MTELTTQHSTSSETAPDPGGSGAACCLNCSAELQGRYCSQCGQRAGSIRQPLHRFARESLGDLFGVDGRIWRTLRILIFLPGRLTSHYVAGRRNRYVSPVRLYLAASLTFFFLVAIVDPVGRVRPADFISDLPEDAPPAPTSVNERLAFVNAEIDLATVMRERYAPRLDTMPTPALTGFMTRLDSLEQALAAERDHLVEVPGDSIVEPQVHATMTRLIATSAPISEIHMGLPSWLPQSPAVRRVQQAQTVPEAMEAGQELARSTIKRFATMMFIMLPLFAFLLKVVYIRRDWYYAEHVVFALHIHTLLFIVLGICLMLAILGSGSTTFVIINILLVSTVVYFLIAQRVVYRQGFVKGLLKAAIVGWFYFFLLSLGVFAALAIAAAWG